MSRAGLTSLVLTAVVAVSPAVCEACATCFGDPNSNLVKGAKAGVLFLGIVVYGLLLSMAGVTGMWIMRARRLQQIDPSGESSTSKIDNDS